MKKAWILVFALILTFFAVHSSADGVMAALNQKIATRTGPSTRYDEPGTFFSSAWKTTQVRVLSKVLTGSTWWVQIEFQNQNRLYRAYTGLKRVNVNPAGIREETLLGYGTMNAAGDVTALFGPGENYARMDHDIPWSVDVTVWGAENGYLLVDFFDEYLSIQRRAWVYSDLVDVVWKNGIPPAGSIPAQTAGIQPGKTYYASGEHNLEVTILQYAEKGGYSILSLSIDGITAYPALAVEMEKTNSGTFSTGNGGGEVWFDADQLIMELFLPSDGLSDVYVLSAGSI